MSVEIVTCSKCGREYRKNRYFSKLFREDIPGNYYCNLECSINFDKLAENLANSNSWRIKKSIKIHKTTIENLKEMRKSLKRDKKTIYEVIGDIEGGMVLSDLQKIYRDTVECIGDIEDFINTLSGALEWYQEIYEQKRTEEISKMPKIIDVFG